MLKLVYRYYLNDKDAVKTTIYPVNDAEHAIMLVIAIRASNKLNPDIQGYLFDLYDESGNNSAEVAKFFREIYGKKGK